MSQRGRLSLAPAGVVRAAAWPLQALNGFGSEPVPEAGAACFERHYQAVLERERAFLWSTFDDDSRFRKALVLASRSAHARIHAAAGRRDGPRNRAMRQAEHTLYRYLARATGRCTPHGLWAGVTELRFGTSTRADPVAPRTRFSPDLRPFQGMLRQLGRRSDYRLRSLWRLNPTLVRSTDGNWAFLHRAQDGVVSLRHLAADPQLNQILTVLAKRPALSLDRAAAELAGDDVWALGARRRLIGLLNHLADAGVLVGGLDLPVAFETAWDALTETADRLQTAHRDAWHAALANLRTHCDRLSRDLDDLAAADLDDALEQARITVFRLARQLEVDPSPANASVLRCDHRLPWRLTLGPETAAAVLAAVENYQAAWIDGASPAAGWRRMMRRGLADRLGRGAYLVDAASTLAREFGNPPSVWPAPARVEDAALRRRLQAWAECLNAPGAETRLNAGQPEPVPAVESPLGCAFVDFEGDDRLGVRSTSDIATLSLARHSALLDTRALIAWVGRHLDEYAQAQQIQFATLLAPFELNPNVLGAPSLPLEAIAPWTAGPGPSLLGARLRAGVGDGELRLHLPGQNGDWIVVSTGAANLQARDPLTQLLLWTGHHESPGRGQGAVEVPLDGEFDRGRPTPRVRLSCGASLRPSRSLLRAPLDRLLRLRGPERFRQWQLLARDHGWPERLTVSFAGGEPLRVHRDSPLAIEALFKGVAPATPFMSVSAAEPDAGFEVPEIGACAVELSIPFARQQDIHHGR